MKILLTGASGYVGKRLLHTLAEKNHEIVALVRSDDRFSFPEIHQGKIEVFEADLLKPESLKNSPKDIDAAYYLVHSMGQQSTGFFAFEQTCAENFVKGLQNTQVKQIIYLSGLSKDTAESEHMRSRHNVESILQKSGIPVTILRAGIVVGSGSASFEIMRDLVEKLPMMVAPRWVNSRCQPIAIFDLLHYLSEVLNHTDCLNKTFEVGGPSIMTYKEMLLQFAKIRKLKRFIITIPVLTPYLSSLWLVLVTTTNLSIAKALIESLKVDAICSENTITQIIPHQCLSFEESIERAFSKIEQNAVVSSWKDALTYSRLEKPLHAYIEVPTFGCYKHIQNHTYQKSKEEVINRLWSIGGSHGWYAMNWAWRLRGFFDKCIGGVGLRRGRTHRREIHAGDALDFWRVITANKEEGSLLLYAEMRLPGEGWLGWKIDGNEQQTTIVQTVTYRPKGVFGRLYWYILYPFHALIFHKMCDKIGQG